jgi:hypothetical protein
MGRRHARPFRRRLLGAAGEVVRVGLKDRDRGVGCPKRGQLLLLVTSLVPGPVDPGRSGARLAAQRVREAPQRIGGPRAGEEAQAQAVDRRRQLGAQLPARRVGHLDAPGAGIGAADAVEAGLRVVNQNPVAIRREQPGHREVGGVLAPVTQAPGRDEGAEERVLDRLVGAVRNVAFDRPARLVDPVRALAEAEVALARPGREPHAHRLHAERRAVQARVERDYTGPGGAKLEVDLVGGRGGCEPCFEEPATAGG